MGKRLDLRKVECPSCGLEVEIDLHVFKECHTIRAIAFASKWGVCLDRIPISNMEEWMEFCMNPPGKYKIDRQFAVIFFATLMYCSWEHRNKVMHNGDTIFERVVIRFNNLVEEFLEVGKDSNHIFKDQDKKEQWSKLHIGWIKANVDASFATGRASLAVAVRDEEGNVIRILSYLISANLAREAEPTAITWASEVAELE